MATDDLVKRVREREPNCAKIGLFDMDGIFRGKYMGADKLASALAGGFGFCDVVLGWDSNDQLYDNVRYTGWHSAYPDAEVRLLPDTERVIPFEGDMPLLLAEFAGAAEAICPRGLLRRVLEPRRGARLQGEGGGGVRILRLRGDAAIGPRQRLSRSEADHARPFRLFGAALASMPSSTASSGRPARRCGSSSKALHTETGPGVLEAAIRVDDALEAADKARLVQDVHQDPRPAARLDGDLHGEMVARLAGPIGPSPPVAGRCARRRVASSTRRARSSPCRTRCAGSSAASRL